MRAYYINGETDRRGTMDVEPRLSEYYKLIGCDCVDFVTRLIDGHPYNIILDDEGLLKPNRVTAISTMVDMFGDPERLAGSLLIFGVDRNDLDTGNAPLTDHEVMQISNHVRIGLFADGELHPYLEYTGW